MRTVIKNIGILLFTCLAFSCGREKITTVARMDEGKIIVRIDSRWNDSVKKDFMLRFGLDSLLFNAVDSGKNSVTAGNRSWKLSRIDQYITEAVASVTSDLNISRKDVLMFDEPEDTILRNDIRTEDTFGVNNLRNPDSFSFRGDTAIFILEGHKGASQVFLAGSFNNWNAMKTPLTRTVDGWRAELKLEPGKYHYKYIIDGRWITDPGNNLRMRNKNIGLVSVIYMPDFVFELNDQQDASAVVVTGNFIQWNRKGIPMLKENGRWYLPVYLRDGTYAYKFIADGKWLTDPANPDIRYDTNGNLNSFIGIGNAVIFNLTGYSGADKVVLTGSFNNWDRNELLMNKTSTGWSLKYHIMPGIYEYKFIADGQWLIDSDNPFTAGKGSFTNSVISVKPNHTFILKGYENAREVIVTGTFTGWNHEKYRMVKQDGSWIFNAYLRPGKYLYKFIVEGEWILDPSNNLWEENEWGTGNSVLWIENSNE